MAEKHTRHTVTLNDEALRELKAKGRFGESYSEVILRVIDQAESVKEED
jgi:hypothetical protein